MSAPRAQLVDSIHPIAVQFLTEAWFAADLVAAPDGVQPLGLRSKTTLNEAVRCQRPDQGTIGACCIGTNQIALAVPPELGLAEFNAPHSKTRSVVELAIAEIISLARRLLDKDRVLQAGVWDKSAAVIDHHALAGAEIDVFPSQPRAQGGLLRLVTYDSGGSKP